MKDILVMGATSAIAQAVCRACVKPGARFWLLGRSAERLRIVAEDLRARGAAAVEIRAIGSDFNGLKVVVDEGFRVHGRFDLFLAAQGSLPDQADLDARPQLLTEFFQANAVAIMQAALIVAPEFERQGGGAIVIVGSVAGDRGRVGNYVYGASKSALDTFCEGLRQRLAPPAVVLLVKPGPVDTPMTAHLKKSALFTTPEKVAAVILSGVRRRASVVYAPFFWRWIMTIIRLLPRKIVKRLRA
jgi:short-subunit dehydrogenase